MDNKQSAVIACDVTLFIRLLEIAREELKSDEQLHDLVERCSEQAAAKGDFLTMDDYETIMPPAEDKALGASIKINAANRLRARAEASAKITIEGSQECVDRVLALLGVLHNNGGHSGTFGIDWDGDGADSIRVKGKDFNPKKYRDLTNALSDYGGHFEIVSEGGTGYVHNPIYDEDENYARMKSTKVYPPEDQRDNEPAMEHEE